MLTLDAPIRATPPGEEYQSGLPRNRPPAYLDGPPVKGFDRSPSYVRNMGDDTPIQAYSLREDYEKNSEWYPTKTIRDWKTVDSNNESTRYPPVTAPIHPSKVGTRRMPKTTDRSDLAFDRSRG